MKFSEKQYAQALYMAMAEVSEEQMDMVIDSLVALLKKNGDISLYSEIVDEFEKIDNQMKGKVNASLDAVHGGSVQEELVRDLNKIASKDLSLKISENSELLGGIILNTEDILLDASVKEKLKKLENSMIN